VANKMTSYGMVYENKPITFNGLSLWRYGGRNRTHIMLTDGKGEARVVCGSDSNVGYGFGDDVEYGIKIDLQINCKRCLNWYFKYKKEMIFPHESK
jgi:hypothetical protein